jgi:hypothetical protein
MPHHNRRFNAGRSPGFRGYLGGDFVCGDGVLATDPPLPLYAFLMKMTYDFKGQLLCFFSNAYS